MILTALAIATVIQSTPLPSPATCVLNGYSTPCEWTYSTGDAVVSIGALMPSGTIVIAGNLTSTNTFDTTIIGVNDQKVENQPGQCTLLRNPNRITCHFKIGVKSHTFIIYPE